MPTKKLKRETESLLSEITRECPPQYADKQGFVFQAFETVIFEVAADYNRYEYTAINIVSGKSELIDRKRRPLQRTAEDEAALLRKLRKSRVAGKSHLEIDSDASLPIEKLREVMYAVFHEILKHYGYTVRQNQIELAERILDAIVARGILLAEAAVGIGKTLAYTIIAVLVKRSRLNEHYLSGKFSEISYVEWKRMPVVVSTKSIALQRAIVNDVIPIISDILMDERIITTPLCSLLVKGKRHFICEHNLRAYIPFENKAEIKETLERIEFDGRIIDLAEVEGLPAHVKRKICVPDRCYTNCPNAKTCRYRNYREVLSESGTNDGTYRFPHSRKRKRTADIDIIVTNHQMLLMSEKLRLEDNKGILPPYMLLVLDEAHEFLQAARTAFGSTLDIDAAYEITKAIGKLNFTLLDKTNAEDWREVRSIILKVTEKLYNQNKRLFAKNNADDTCDRHLAHIRNFADELIYDLKKSAPFKNKLDEERKRALLFKLERLSKGVTALGNRTENIRWFETGKNGNAALCSLPKNLNELIYNVLWKREIPTLLTSGTLSVGNDFSALKQSLGLDSMKRLYETTQASPYDYRENALLYISECVPHYKTDGYLDALADEVSRLIYATNGHTTVLFTSYAVMNKVCDALEKRGMAADFNLYKLERATSDAINRFKESKAKTGKPGVLFASGALWEGIDIPGDALSSLIIIKLPFAVPDAVSEFERAQYTSGYEYLNKVLVPEMLIKLKQGFGRLIRTEKDTGIVAILDCRVNSKGSYREYVLNALPACCVTDNVDDVRSFIEAKKSPEYFENTVFANLFPSWEKADERGTS